MFEDMVISSPHPSKTNKPWTVVVSMVAQSIFLAILILIPLIYTEALPKTMMSTLLWMPANSCSRKSFLKTLRSLRKMLPM